MAHVSTGVEYALHCLLRLVNLPAEMQPPSARDIAELQGLPADFVATIMTKLHKAGVIRVIEGVRGGVRLAKPAAEISFLDVVTAIDGRKRMFDCRNVRSRCVLFDGTAPDWAVAGVCSIHAVMLEAEAQMQDVLARRSLADVAATAARRVPPDFLDDTRSWMADRGASRRKRAVTVTTIGGDVADPVSNGGRGADRGNGPNGWRDER